MSEQILIQQLLSILTQMHQTIKVILELEDQKYDIIKNMEIDQLIQINTEESALLYQIENYEFKRKDIIESLSLKIGFNKDLSIKEICPFLPEDQNSQILNLSMMIKNTCERLDVITDRNDYLLHNNVEIISQILELAQGTPSEQYNKTGLTTELKQQGLHMLDQLV